MKTTAALILCLVFLTCSACVRSLNPFYTDDVKADIKGIKGHWQMIEDNGSNKCCKSWYFCDDQIRTCSDKGVSGVLKAVYFRIGDSVFVDTTADTLPDGLVNEWWQFHMLPVHFVSKVELNGDDMVIKPLDNEWFKENIGVSGLDASMLKTNAYDSLAIDIKPEEWMKFLRKCANDGKAFSGKSKYTFRRERPPEPDAAKKESK